MTVTVRQNLTAVLLALLLGLAWTWSDWTNLSALRLPDTDDAMRLQQIRDWIGGQDFADVSQHRLAGGLAMHWSRIGDLVPAGLILLFQPLIGEIDATRLAVVAWPLAQFAAMLLLVRAIMTTLAPRAATTAVVLAALAYPATTLFLPGRIDHHGLQVLLVLIQFRALLAPADWSSGAIAGAAVAVGAAIGLETLPFACVTAAVVAIGWLRGSGTRQIGFGLALAAGLLVLLPIAGHGGACDTIAPLAPAAIAGALALAALGRIDHHRIVFLIATGAAWAVLAWPAAQSCFSGPYGAIDPLVARLWLAQVAEAQPLLSAPIAQATGYAGVMIVGIGAGGWLAWRRGGCWRLLLTYQATALAITLLQLRGAYVGAALAVLPIAVLLVEQRTRGRTAAVLALWIGGSGLSWALLAGAVEARSAHAAAADHPGSCTDPQGLATLAALPPGRMMTGIDLGAYAIAATRHMLIAAPYHRNDAGNRAMLRFFLGTPDAAERIARAWRIDYVVRCPGDFGAIRPAPGTIGGGAIPAWLVPIGPRDRYPAVFAVRPGLSARPDAR